MNVMPQITVKLTGLPGQVAAPDPARPGRSLRLTPMFGGATDADLQMYFTAEADDEHLNAVLRALREDPHVEAAYVKPPDAPP